MGRPRGQAPSHVREARKTTWKIRQHQRRVAGAEPGEKTDQELIEEAIADGRVTKLPDGYAFNHLTWNAFGGRKGGSE